MFNHQFSLYFRGIGTVALLTANIVKLKTSTNWRYVYTFNIDSLNHPLVMTPPFAAPPPFGDDSAPLYRPVYDNPASPKSNDPVKVACPSLASWLIFLDVLKMIGTRFELNEIPDMTGYAYLKRVQPKSNIPRTPTKRWGHARPSGSARDYSSSVDIT